MCSRLPEGLKICSHLKKLCASEPVRDKNSAERTYHLLGGGFGVSADRRGRSWLLLLVLLPCYSVLCCVSASLVLCRAVCCCGGFLLRLLSVRFVCCVGAVGGAVSSVDAVRPVPVCPVSGLLSVSVFMLALRLCYCIPFNDGLQWRRGCSCERLCFRCGISASAGQVAARPVAM